MKRLIAILVVMAVLIPVLVQAQVTSTVERQYKWYAEEKLTVGSSVVQLSSEEYNYIYGWTRITVDGYNGKHFELEETITDGTTAAMGILKGYDDSNAPSYLDIQILYNGLNSADFDPNDVLTGTTSDANCTIRGDDSYTRGVAARRDITEISPQVARIHVLDNSLIYTLNGALPVYSSTNSACVGTKKFVTDTFYIYGSEAIANFKATRAGTSDCIIYVYYGL